MQTVRVGFYISLVFGSVSAADAVIYDDFDDSNFLSAERWETPERTNLVVNDKLVSALRRFGATASSNSSLPNSRNIDSMQAVVNVNSIDVIGNPEIRARVGGLFCDSNNTADGNLGEVYAETALVQQTDGTFSFRYSVFQCGDASCGDGTELLDMFFGNPQLNVDYVAALSFDPGSKTFSFSLDGGNLVTFGPTDAPALQNCGVSNTSFKVFGTRIVVEPDAIDEGGAIRAAFDDVVINGTPYDDFSSGALDPAKWNDSEGRVAVETENGNNVLRIEQNLTGRDRSFGVRFTDPASIDAVRADLRIDRTTIDAADGEAAVRARLAGKFYNDGASSGVNDQTGDVFAQIWLRRRVNGSEERFEVACGVSRAENADSTENSDVFFEFFDATWKQGQTYQVSLGFDSENKTFFCGFNGQTITYTLQSSDPQPDNMPNPRAFRQLGSRIDRLDGLGDRGEISAVFDNVQVFPPRVGGDVLFTSSFERFPEF